MNCIFICIFNQDKYVDMFYLLLESILIYSKIDENTEILLYTSTPFMNMIKQNQLFNMNKIRFEINDTYNNVDTACKARLDLFTLKSIINYKKIIYLDTDILVKSDINKVFDICKEDILYVLEEGNINDNRDFWGKTLFNNEINNYTDKSAFTSGILLFNNCEKIKKLFEKITEDIVIRPHNFSCYDQPYIVYNAFKYKLYNNKDLKTMVVNNDYNIHSDKIIYHFPGGPGIYQNKIKKMTEFLNKLNKENFKQGIKVYDTKMPPNKNISFSLVGICVSYNYFDTLQFMLPINYLHFEQIYLITQEDDIETIEFCKRFENVTILYYNFKNNDCAFDKYGALNYAQTKAYGEYPNSWYLIIDSDIILPNNFIDILKQDDLNVECIYGAIRNNCFKSSELLDKQKIINKTDNLNWIYNNILWNKKTPPSILGCFQLYKKKVYHRDNLKNAGGGDYYFGYDNFELFSMFDNIIYFHLGHGNKNWYGKTTSFIDDIKISINDIYYVCNKKSNFIYYDNKQQLVQYGSSIDINNDIWTCSEQMRYDIYTFFKYKSDLKIAEIGSYKGYTTKILANIFSKVYSVDNSVEFIDMNKELNKKSNNICYVLLDIYKDSWEILPDDIEVSFIDAVHSYEKCKQDIKNSIKRFKNLQYIICDDYGVWSGVKQIVDELINKNILIFEKYIGIKDVPGPNGIVKNVNEGIICRINKQIATDNILNMFVKTKQIKLSKMMITYGNNDEN